MGICNLRLCLGLAAGIALAGCGGSDDSPSTPPAPAPAPTPAPPPPPTAITVAGTAVKGAALAGAAISVKCAAGNGTTTAAATGAYTVTLTGGALPCVVKAAGTDGTTYHSVVPGRGDTGAFTANVSPLTEMVVARLAELQPADLFTRFNDEPAGFGTFAAWLPTDADFAISYVQTAMAGLTNLTGVNPLTDPLVVGNSLDVKIDQVMAGWPLPASRSRRSRRRSWRIRPRRASWLPRLRRPPRAVRGSRAASTGSSTAARPNRQFASSR